MAATLLQSVPTAGSFPATPNASATFGSACTPGSKIVVLITNEHYNRPVTGISDGTNTYAKDKEAVAVASAGCAEIWSCENTSSSALTVTVTCGGNTFGYVNILEIGGLASTSDIDATAENAEDTSPPYTIDTSLTTTTDNCAIVAVAAYFGGLASTADSGWTSVQMHVAGSSNYHSAEYILDAGSAGSETITFGGLNTRAYFGACSVAYKLAAGGGGGSGAAMAYLAQL